MLCLVPDKQSRWEKKHKSWSMGRCVCVCVCLKHYRKS